MKTVAAGLLIFGSVCYAADDVHPGKKDEMTYCVACHSTRLIESQRLSSTAWGKELDKMAGWGAVIPQAQRQILLDYLAFRIFKREADSYASNVWRRFKEVER